MYPMSNKSAEFQNSLLDGGGVDFDVCTVVVVVVSGSKLLMRSSKESKVDSSEDRKSVARWQNLIPSFPWIAPGWRMWGRNPKRGRGQILQRHRPETRRAKHIQSTNPAIAIWQPWIERVSSRNLTYPFSWHCSQIVTLTEVTVTTMKICIQGSTNRRASGCVNAAGKLRQKW